ncbi:hypothetical protein [Yoonia sediminilitoris]|uniref:Component of SufBCD complex n=1 Tax=Yoonia sediminilitoris TaxID=1286148 RepID=A0A2T6KCX8_9RHOB|nr:hypothetical protein [Yoonia sediminilitoris]PUB12813.1 hypothetical protein C8N45_109124 [Yoonia sediminilitoris]RCW94292.1 hypothetical protein DFP92_109124 [Yoonia sediminilitoris]
MDWNDAIFQVISLHTFSNVWYWLAVAVTWSTASHWIIGVPFDMIHRARRNGDQATADLEAIVAINVRRLIAIADVAGLWLMGFAAFVLSVLAMAGFYYGFELAQGFFCIALPLTVVVILNIRLSMSFARSQPTGDDLVHALLGLRFWIQTIAMVSIFATAMYGMYHNLSLPLGFR